MEQGDQNCILSQCSYICLMWLHIQSIHAPFLPSINTTDHQHAVVKLCWPIRANAQWCMLYTIGFHCAINPNWSHLFANDLHGSTFLVLGNMSEWHPMPCSTGNWGWMPWITGVSCTTCCVMYDAGALSEAIPTASEAECTIVACHKNKFQLTLSHPITPHRCHGFHRNSWEFIWGVNTKCST